MSIVRLMNIDILYLQWTDYKTNNKYVIGQLTRKENLFEFKYGIEVNEAIEQGFQLLIAFEDKNKIYKGKNLFPVFSARIPDKRRKDMGKILKKYGLSEYDEFNLLKATKGKLPIDDLEFISEVN